VSAFTSLDGIVGDLGGGSLELTESRSRATADHAAARRLALQTFLKSVKKAEKIVEKALDGALLEAARPHFYAIGGTWRALARLHMWQKGYPLHVMHGYVIPAKEAYEFSGLVHRVDTRHCQTSRQWRTLAGRCWPMLRWCLSI
jgi:exopolyphosphatase/guanosine-5'-triphosphate,3'-diphosphate pyrophosphatase